MRLIYPRTERDALELFEMRNGCPVIEEGRADRRTAAPDNLLAFNRSEFSDGPWPTVTSQAILDSKGAMYLHFTSLK